MKTLLAALCSALLFALPAAPLWAAQKQGQAPLMQVFLGVLEPDDQTGEWDEISDDGADVDPSRRH